MKDKFQLIEMVRQTPILWDSAQPNFKGAEKEKNEAWERIAKYFNTSGRKIQRTFKSLRESYRRELANTKSYGSDYDPKWAYFQSMDFLRHFIRERRNGLVPKLDSSTASNRWSSDNLNDISNNGVTSSNDNNSSMGHIKNESIDIEDMHNGDDYDDDDMEDDYPFPEIMLDTTPPAMDKRKSAYDSHCEEDVVGHSNGRSASREVLHGKFCEYLAARLNSMAAAEADDLMNNIFKLFTQK